jgi:hypothetical protein
MQKFTRPLTREIELAGGRLALTFTEQGMSIRPVGSRKPPWEVSWDKIITQATGMSDAEAAIDLLKKADDRPTFPAAVSQAPAVGASSIAEHAASHAPAAETAHHASTGSEAVAIHPNEPAKGP